MSQTAAPEIGTGSRRGWYYHIATVACLALTGLSFEILVFAVPAFMVATVILSRLAIRHGVARFPMDVMAVVSVVLAVPVLIALPFLLINLPHLSVGGVSLDV